MHNAYLQTVSDVFFLLFFFKPHQLCAHSGETAATGAGARESHERDGAGDVAEREGGRALQNLGGTGGQLPSAAGQTKAILQKHLYQIKCNNCSTVFTQSSQFVKM